MEINNVEPGLSSRVISVLMEEKKRKLMGAGHIEDSYKEIALKKHRAHWLQHWHRPVADQLLVFKDRFPYLDTSSAIRIYKNLKEPEEADCFLIFPWPDRIAKNYPSALRKILTKLSTRENFLFNERDLEFHLEDLETSNLSDSFLDKARRISGDFGVVPAQFGFKYRGASVCDLNSRFSEGEAGATLYMVACALLTDPDLISRKRELSIVCGGDSIFGFLSPCFHYRKYDNRVELTSKPVVIGDKNSGVATFFAPKIRV